MEFQKPVVQVTKVNELPRMYDSWTDFYYWWHPWVLASGEKTLTIVDYGTGVITESVITWSHVTIMCVQERSILTSNLPNLRQYRVLKWMKVQWDKISYHCR